MRAVRFYRLGSARPEQPLGSVFRPRSRPRSVEGDPPPYRVRLVVSSGTLRGRCKQVRSTYPSPLGTRNHLIPFRRTGNRDHERT